MAYNAPAAFRRTFGSQKKEFKQYPKDVLGKVIQIDPAAQHIVAESERGEICIYRISADAARRGRSSKAGSETSKFNGNMINEQMARHIKAGRRIVFERAIYSTTITHNGEKTKVYECTWIINSKAQSEAKLFRGIATINEKDQRVSWVQHWAQNAINVNDEESLNAYKDTIQAFKEQTDSHGLQGLPANGFMLRYITRDSEAADMWTCVESTEPLDYVRGVKNEAGEFTRNPSVPGRAELTETIQGFTEYIIKRYPESHGLMEAGLATIDVMTYKPYKATVHGEVMVIPEPFTSLAGILVTPPLTALARTPARAAADSEDFISGKMIAVDGIIELTPDDVDVSVDPPARKPRNIVQKLHPNAFRGDVRSMVRAADGKKVQLMPGLAVNANKQAPAAQQPVQDVPEITDLVRPSAEQSVLDLDDMDLFGGFDD